MATNWYSSAFHETGIAATARSTGGFQAAPGTTGGSGAFRYAKFDLSTAAAVAAMANNDILVCLPIRPWERLRTLFVSAQNTFNSATTFTLNGLGLATLDAFGNFGALLNNQLFASAVALKTTAIDHVDLFTESTTLGNLDRMSAFWELINVAVPGTYTKPPRENWCISGRFGISGAVSAGGIITIEAEIYPF